MLGTGFEHKNAALFFDNVGWNFLETFWTNGSRRFDEAIKSKFGLREFAIRRGDIYEFSRGVQVCLLYTSDAADE